MVLILVLIVSIITSIITGLIVVIIIHRSWWSTHPHRPHRLAFHALASFTAPWGRPVHYIINKHKQPLQPTMPPVIWCRGVLFAFYPQGSRQPLKSPSIAGGALWCSPPCADKTSRVARTATATRWLSPTPPRHPAPPPHWATMVASSCELSPPRSPPLATLRLFSSS